MRVFHALILGNNKGCKQSCVNFYNDENSSSLEQILENKVFYSIHLL